MLRTLKTVIKRSPMGPLAVSLYSLALPPGKREGRLRSLRYDLQTVEVMRRHLRQDSSCIDIGAHEGEILRSMTKLCPRGQHVAFEPIPHLAARLRVRYPGVAVHEVACGAQPGAADFVLVENAPAYSGLRRRIYDRPDVKLTTIQVQVARVDDLVSHPVALIKVDVEGGEYHALSGAERTIARCRPVIVLEAGAKSAGQYGVGPQDFTRFFDRLGYRVSTMERWLASRPPLTAEAFAANWFDGPDYYFIASPVLSC
jgi:FkbM family methyltransferase